MRSSDRVVALDERGSLLGEAFVEQDGDWSLSVTKPAKWLIAQLSGWRLVAVVARAATSSVIEMPDLVRLFFTSAVHGAALWLDPIGLEGFPKHLVPVLRTHPHRIVDLHLATFSMSRRERSGTPRLAKSCFLSVSLLAIDCSLPQLTRHVGVTMNGQ